MKVDDPGSELVVCVITNLAKVRVGPFSRPACFSERFLKVEQGSEGSFLIPGFQVTDNRGGFLVGK